MGLSSKQVSRDGVGWNLALLQADHQQLPKPTSMKRQQPTTINQQQQAAAEPPLKCPRCDSTNTKFCYYNNYNKTQPRHFCKACKRHWTKGGTLRNVPVGGGRKNKRIKTSNTSAAATAITTTTTSGSNINNNNRVNNNNTHLAIQCHQQQQPIISRQNNLGNFVIGDHDQKNFSEILYQAMIHQHHNHYHSPVVPSSSNFIGSSSNHESSLRFPYSSSTSFDTTTTPSSISNSINQSSNVYNYAGSETIIDDPSSSTGMINSTPTQPWQVSNTSTAMDTTTTSFCNWDDIIDTFASSTQDLNIPNWVVDDSHDHHTKP